MDPDNLQQAWQAQSSQTRVTIDADLLLKEVQRNQRDFRSLIFRRDFREVGIALVMLPVWFYLGIKFSEPWTWYLVVPADIWVIGFFLVDRRRHKQKPSEPGEPLLQCVERSLTEVDHQIGLLRNVFRWYLLPFTIPILAYFAQVSWQISVLAAKDWWVVAGSVGFFAYLVAFLCAVYGFIDYINQRAIRTQLEPRRQELLALLADLAGDDSTQKQAMLSGAKSVQNSQLVKRWLILAVISIVTYLVIALVLASGLFNSSYNKPAKIEGPQGASPRGEHVEGTGYPRKAPFAAVRWQQSQPEVKVGEEWFKLVSLDGLPSSDIVAFSQRTYGNKWQKRFEEDLVELLTRMGHPPQDTVTLVVQPLTSSKTRTLENVPMTEANRRAIWDAAQARERGEQQPATSSAVPMSDAEIPFPDLITGLRKEKQLVGLAATAMVDGEVVASAVDGERKNGSGVRLEIGDRWHLGSITKSITATMIARLVESGQMQWSDSIGKYFPDAYIHEEWKPVTLKELLTHTAGAPPNFPFLVALQHPALGPECTRARRAAVLNVLAEKPAHPPGKEFAYSNVDYTIAGAMAEKATGATWEDLVKREVFEPLKLTGAGFGPPKSPDETLEQPRGHRPFLSWKVPVDDEADNTPIMGPAGSVHMTLRDLCTYANEHLQGELGQGNLLSAETYKLLHAPKLDNYACGWVMKKPSADIPHTIYWHNGSNTMWFALVVFIPEKKMVVAVTANDGDIEKAEAAAWEILKACVKQFNMGADSSRPTPAGSGGNRLKGRRLVMMRMRGGRRTSDTCHPAAFCRFGKSNMGYWPLIKS